MPPIEPSQEQMSAMGKSWLHVLSPEGLDLILRLPRNALKEPERASLKRLADHFAADNPESDSVPRGPGRPPKAGPVVRCDESWRTIRVLQELKLDPVLLRDLASWKQEKSSHFLGAQPASLATDPAAPEGERTAMELLVLRCFALRRLRSEKIVNHVRWLFMLLLIGDLAEEMFGSGCVLNKKKEEELRQSIIKQYESLNEEKKKEINYSGGQNFALELSAYAKSALTQGQVLRLLCERFTTGCLFWLQDTLTENFIKYRTTKSGKAYEHAIKVLKELKLADMAEQSGATELCDTIRAEHRRIYKIDVIARDSCIE